jgi:hypothetical protein
MNINPTTLALIIAGAGFLGAIVPSVLALRIARITKDSEERKHHKEIVVKAAIENWKQVAEFMFKGNLSGKLTPLDTFIVHMSKLADVAFDPTTNLDNLKERLAEIEQWTDVAVEAAKDMKRI